MNLKSFLDYDLINYNCSMNPVLRNEFGDFERSVDGLIGPGVSDLHL